MCSVANFRLVDTSPDSGTAFSLPTGWEGEYRDYLRQRWKDDLGFRQLVFVVGRMQVIGVSVRFSGPYASEALEAVTMAYRAFVRKQSSEAK